MSLSREQLNVLVQECKDEEEVVAREGLGGNALRTIITTVKIHGPLRLLISILKLPFTFFMAIVLIKEGKTDRVPRLLRYGEATE